MIIDLPRPSGYIEIVFSHQMDNELPTMNCVLQTVLCLGMAPGRLGGGAPLDKKLKS